VSYIVVQYEPLMAHEPREAPVIVEVWGPWDDEDAAFEWAGNMADVEREHRPDGQPAHRYLVTRLRQPVPPIALLQAS
jgi:hypothetical protein